MPGEELVAEHQAVELVNQEVGESSKNARKNRRAHEEPVVAMRVAKNRSGKRTTFSPAEEGGEGSQGLPARQKIWGRPPKTERARDRREFLVLGQRDPWTGMAMATGFKCGTGGSAPAAQARTRDR